MRKAGTKDNPVCLESDDEDGRTFANSSAKRRKVGDGRAVSGTAPGDEIVPDMLQVKKRLMTARTDVNNSQAEMRAVFNKHHQRFDDDEIMRVLVALSKHMNKVFDGAKDGMESIDQAVAWINSRGDSTIDMIE